MRGGNVWPDYVCPRCLFATLRERTDSDAFETGREVGMCLMKKNFILFTVMMIASFPCAFDVFNVSVPGFMFHIMRYCLWFYADRPCDCDDYVNWEKKY